VTQTSYPFDGQSVNESQFSEMFREFTDSGVAASADDLDLKVSADGADMTVDVQPGFAIVRGFAYASTAVEAVTISASNTQLRVDRVVLRLDPSANSIVLAVLTGTPGSATPPALTQTDTGIYELSLAQVTVGASVAVIAAGNVADDRTFGGIEAGCWSDTTRPTTARLGTPGFNRTTAAWEYWNGSAWTALVPDLAWSAIQGKPSTFTPSAHTQDWSTITGKPSTFAPSAHTHGWADITGTSPYSLTSHTHNYAPAVHTHNIPWDQVTGKPSTYPPSSHTQDWSTITGKPSTYPPSSHTHSYASLTHTHDYAPSSHGHDPSGIGIRSGTYTFGSVGAGSEASATLSKYSNERVFCTVNHASSYILAHVEEISSTQFKIEVRNTTSSTTHSNIIVNYLLVRTA